MNKKIIFIFLIFLMAAICLSPRFSIGQVSDGRQIDIRAEDLIIFLGLIICLAWFSVSGKHKFIPPPLFWPIIAWISFGFFSTAFNILYDGLSLDKALFYFLKEIEFFVLYFLVFYCVSNFDLNRRLIKYWLFFSLANIFWLMYVLICDVKWSYLYGPNTFVEPKGPFPSGGFFLMFFIFFLNMFVFYYRKLDISKRKKIFLFILCVAPAIGVISSGSRTAVVGIFFSLIVTSFLYFWDSVTLSRFIKAIILFAFITIIFMQIMYLISFIERITSLDVVANTSWRISLGPTISAYPESRFSVVKENLSTISKFSLPHYIMGLGVKGEAHSHYMRVIIERGIVGLGLFLWLMLSVAIISYSGFKDKNNYFKKSLSAGLLVATLSMLVMAISNDTFMVVKIDEIYWFFTAMAMAVIAKGQNENVLPHL